MIKRDDYLAKLVNWKDREVIKVVTGVRRCGKSTLFALYMDYLKSQGVEAQQIIAINLEDVAFESLRDYKKLYRYIADKMCSGQKNYIFIDEVHRCAQFEKVVDSLFIKENADVYIASSNANMLSGELSTMLSGRYIAIDMLPLSFEEFSSAVAGKTEEEKFNEYLTFGSFPSLAELLENQAICHDYIEGIYHTILMKDVASREGITDVSLLERIVKVLIANIGSSISSNKIANIIALSGRKISVNTVERYLKCLTDSDIFYKVDRYDIKGRDSLRTLPKYYLVDTGIRNLLVANSASDIGHMIENVVYLELLRRGYDVSVGKLGDKEVDFIASTGKETIYLQVSVSVLDENTLKRELQLLQKINDNYPKMLLTLDRIGAGSNYDGILQHNLIDWLLGRV
ncbi:MAG: ATP-binding protein [Faecalibacterium sp.]